MVEKQFLCPCSAESKRGRLRLVKEWEMIADNLKRAGFRLGWVSALDLEGRTIWIVDAHRDDGRRFIVHADEILTGFVELERQVLTTTFYLQSIQAGDR